MWQPGAVSKNMKNVTHVYEAAQGSNIKLAISLNFCERARCASLSTTNKTFLCLIIHLSHKMSEIWSIMHYL